MKDWIRLAVPMLALAMTACGTTSNVKSGTSEEAVAALPDVSGYDKVVVLDFTDATDKSKIKPKDLQAYTDAVTTATRTFPDLIAQKLRTTGAFTEVTRAPLEGKTLQISGKITRYQEGNAAARLLVGFGAGSSYFDATTDLVDTESNAALGHVTTDKNSWALGGAIAATQNVNNFMQGAAEKIAKDLSTLEKGTGSDAAREQGEGQGQVDCGRCGAAGAAPAVTASTWKQPLPAKLSAAGIPPGWPRNAPRVRRVAAAAGSTQDSGW